MTENDDIAEGEFKGCGTNQSEWPKLQYGTAVATENTEFTENTTVAGVVAEIAANGSTTTGLH